MVTSLGYGRTGSCAAIRAGLSSARLLPGTEVSEGEGQVSPARGHPIPGFVEGFFQAGAWVRLASGALEDLLHEGPFSASDFWQRTGLIALPPLLDPARFMWAIHQHPDASAFFMRPLRDIIGLPIPPKFIEVVAAGHAGVGEALQRAEKLIGSQQVDRVLIIGADSYLDGLSLQWLAQYRRLKSGESPVGLLPGQAGACLLVESDASARARRATSEGHVVAVVVKAPSTEKPPTVTELGRLLAQAVAEALDAAGAPHPFRGDVVLDLNGEEWKAHAWGTAQVLLARRIDFSECRRLLPCESLGETGAASGLLGVGLAIDHFSGGESPDHEALVCSVSDAEQVAVVLVRGAGRQPLPEGRS